MDHDLSALNFGIMKLFKLFKNLAALTENALGNFDGVIAVENFNHWLCASSVLRDGFAASPMSDKIFGTTGLPALFGSTGSLRLFAFAACYLRRAHIFNELGAAGRALVAFEFSHCL